MPDFDPNDDPLRLSGAAGDESLDLPKLMPRVFARARQLAERRCHGRIAAGAHSAGPVLVAEARGVGRSSCSGPIAMLGTRPRRRRRLWTKCHGRPPGPVC